MTVRRINYYHHRYLHMIKIIMTIRKAFLIKMMVIKVRAHTYNTCNSSGIVVVMVIAVIVTFFLFSSNIGGVFWVCVCGEGGRGSSFSM